MNKTLKAAAIALALAGATAIGTANAAEVVFSPGTVAYGYQDGYWSRTREWHAWAKPEDRDTYRKTEAKYYHDWNHDRDADKGWSGPR